MARSERLSLLEVKLGGLLQLRKGTALALLRSVNEERTRAKVLGFLQAAAAQCRGRARGWVVGPGMRP